MSSSITFKTDVIIGTTQTPKSIYLGSDDVANKLVKQSDITSQINAIKNATHFKAAVKYATKAEITDTNTTITFDTTNFDIESNTVPSVGDRIIVRNQTSALTNNGIYEVTQVTGSSPYDITMQRAADFTLGSTALDGSVVHVTDGVDFKNKHLILFSETGLDNVSYFQDGNDITVTEFGTSNTSQIDANTADITTNATKIGYLENVVGNNGTNSSGVVADATITLNTPTTPSAISANDNLKTAINILNQRIYNLHYYINELRQQIEVNNGSGVVSYTSAY